MPAPPCLLATSHQVACARRSFPTRVTTALFRVVVVHTAAAEAVCVDVCVAGCAVELHREAWRRAKK
jgi:hypothetical protein